MDCASELNYSHCIGELNGDTKLITVVRYNPDHGGTQQKNRNTASEALSAAHDRHHICLLDTCVYGGRFFLACYV